MWPSRLGHASERGHDHVSPPRTGCVWGPHHARGCLAKRCGGKAWHTQVLCGTRARPHGERTGVAASVLTAVLGCWDARGAPGHWLLVLLVLLFLLELNLVELHALVQQHLGAARARIAGSFIVLRIML